MSLTITNILMFVFIVVIAYLLGMVIIDSFILTRNKYRQRKKRQRDNDGNQ